MGGCVCLCGFYLWKVESSLTSWIWESLWGSRSVEMHDSVALHLSSLPSVLVTGCACLFAPECVHACSDLKEEGCVSLQGFGPRLHVSREDERYMPLICLISPRYSHFCKSLTLSSSHFASPRSDQEAPRVWYLTSSLQFTLDFCSARVYFFLLPKMMHRGGAFSFAPLAIIIIRWIIIWGKLLHTRRVKLPPWLVKLDGQLEWTCTLIDLHSDQNMCPCSLLWRVKCCSMICISVEWDFYWISLKA